MVSRENRVTLAALLAATVLGGALVAVDLQLHAVGLFVIYAAAILVPQLYLAYTDDDVAVRTRVRVGVLVPILLVLPALSGSGGVERQLLGSLLVALVIALLAYEVVAGYRTVLATNS